MLDQPTLEAWMDGRTVPGVRFGLGEPVLITAGAHVGALGTVVSLISLRPEPVYTVEVGAGRGNMHLPDSALAEA